MRKFLLLVLCPFFMTAQLMAQNRTISGKVTNETGVPLANVSIQVKGTNVGTVSKDDGMYSMSVPSNARVLVFSFADMETKEVSIGSESIVNISLKSNEKALQEVMIVGYGAQTKKSQTGAVSTVAASELENRPFTSFDKMLQGQVPGLLTLAASGQPGATQNVRLRGIGSIAAGANPLYVVDGVPIAAGDISRLTTTSNTFAGINANDIESISVLKDAASTSIYGSQAANGVILITTKKGKAGKAKFRFDAEYGQNDLAYYNDLYKPLNAAEWAMMQTEGLINAGTRPSLADSTVKYSSTYGASARGFDTDWFDLVTRKGQQKLMNLSVSGGGDKGTYYVSGGYYSEDGLVIGSDFKRYSVAIRGRNFVSPKLTVITDMSLGTLVQHTPTNTSAFENPAYLALVLMPTRPAYNADGTINISDFDFLNLPYNPLYLAEHDQKNLNQIKGVGSVTGEYKIIDNLKLTGRFGVDYNNLEEQTYYNPNMGDYKGTGAAQQFYTRNFNWIFTTFADYTHGLFRNRLTMDFKLGYEANQQNILNTDIRTESFPPNMDLTLASNGATKAQANTIVNDKARLSAFSSLIFNYENKYVLSGSFRRDGSSVFGEDNRFGNFWSVGAAWNVDQELWFSDLNTSITMFKIRSSYGVNGNENGFGFYEPLTTYGFGFNYNGLPGSAPNNVGDPTLTWELNKPFNVGLDIGLLKNRITLTAEYYNRATEDLLLAANTSRATGFTSYTTNIGSMENKGVEFQLKANPVNAREFSWTLNFNFAYNKNRITSLYQDKDQVSAPFIRRVGYDYQTFYVRLWAGVDPNNGDPLWYTDQTKKAVTNNVNLAQLTTVGTATPTYFGGFSNTFMYKGLSLDIQLNYAGGNYQRDGQGTLYFSDGASAARNKVKAQLARWQKPGDITNVPRYVLNGNKSSNSSSTRYLYKADYLRLRNIQVGYILPPSITKRLRMEGLNFYVRGTNLYTWVKDKNLPWDPEQGITSQSNANVFIPKTISVGLNLSF